MDDTMLKMMQLQMKIRHISSEELRELEVLIDKNPCRCEVSSECRGVCSVERRLNEELKRREMQRER